MPYPNNHPLATTRARLLDLLAETGILDRHIAQQDYDTDLQQLAAFDSMGLVEAAALIEQEFGVDIPLPLFSIELTSINAIAAHIAAMQAPQAA